MRTYVNLIGSRSALHVKYDLDAVFGVADRRRLSSIRRSRMAKLIPQNYRCVGLHPTAVRGPRGVTGPDRGAQPSFVERHLAAIAK